jgi:hypothetical protein
MIEDETKTPQTARTGSPAASSLGMPPAWACAALVDFGAVV